MIQISPVILAENQRAYYRDAILRRMLLPDIGAAFGGEFFVFQQDSAPSHRAKVTVAVLEQEMPDFIPPTLLAA